MKIKLTIIAVLLLAVLYWAMLDSGSSSIGSDKIEIKFWNLFNGPDGTTMLKMVKRFNEENPDITVRMQRMKLATYYNKIFVAGLGNRTPDVFVVHSGQVERFKSAKLLRPITDLLESENGISIDDFAPRALEAVSRDGEMYGVPLDTHMLGMYYNNELLRQTGFVDESGNPKPPTNLEEFLAVLKANTYDKNWGFTFTWLRTNLFSIMSQYGGEFFNEDYSQCTLNAPENVAALAMCADIVNKYKYSPTPGTEQSEGWIGFCQGRIAIAFEGIYMLPELNRMDTLDFSAAPLPVLGTQKAAWADSHVLCISKDIDGKRRQAAWRLIKFLSDNSLDWAKGGQVPVRKSLLESDTFKSMEIQSVFAQQLPYIRYMPRVPFGGDFCAELDVAAEKALRGTVTAQEALDIATANMNKVIKRYKDREEFGRIGK